MGRHKFIKWQPLLIIGNNNIMDKDQQIKWVKSKM